MVGAWHHRETSGLVESSGEEEEEKESKLVLMVKSFNVKKVISCSTVPCSLFRFSSCQWL